MKAKLVIGNKDSKDFPEMIEDTTIEVEWTSQNRPWKQGEAAPIDWTLPPIALKLRGGLSFESMFTLAERKQCFMEAQITMCQNICPDCQEPAHLCWVECEAKTQPDAWAGILAQCSGAMTWRKMKVYNNE